MADFTDAFVKFLGADWSRTPDFAALSKPKPRSTALAQYLATHNKPGPTLKPASFTKEGAESEEPGIVSKIFSAMDGPRNFMLAQIEDAADNVSEFIQNPSMDELVDIPVDAAKNLGAGVVDTARRMSDLPLGPVLGDLIPDKAKDAAEKRLPDRYFHDVMEDRFGVDNKFAKYGIGFIGDVVTDPLTYIPGGALFTGAKSGKRALSAADRLTQKAAGKPEAFVKPQQPVAPNIPKSPAEMVLKQGGMVRSNQLPPINPQGQKFDLPEDAVFRQPEEPPVAPDFSWGNGDVVQRILADPVSMEGMRQAKRSDNSRRAAWKRWGKDPDKEEAYRANAKSSAAWYDEKVQQKLAKRGKVTDGKGNVSQISIARVLDGIERGEIPRWGPEPAPAKGVARDIAIQNADDQIDAILKKGTREEFNPANQANLYDRHYKATEELFRTDPKLVAKYGNKKGVVKVNSPRVKAARRVMARAMLRTSEDHLTRLGKVPQYWDGTGLRLSDVLEEIGLEANDELATKVLKAWKTKNANHIQEPAVKEAIHRALARRPLHMSSMLEDMSEIAKREADNIFDSAPYSKALERFEKLKEQAADAARAGGATEAEIKAIKDAVSHVINVEKLPADEFMDTLGKRLVEAFEAGRINRKALAQLNQKIVSIAGYSPTDLVGKITGNKYIDSMALRFSTYFGRNHEMKRLSESLMTWGEMNAINRARWLRNMIKAAGNDPKVTFAAFKVAQGVADDTVFRSPQVDALAAQMKSYFETVLGSSGLRDLDMKGQMAGTVAVRSQMVMKDVNKHLEAIGSQFRFTDSAKAKDDFLGVTYDFSGKGDRSWVDSWVLANPKGGKDPLSFLYDIDQAIERTVKEYALLDEFVTHFGVRKGSKAFDPKIHRTKMPTKWSARIDDDIYFDPQTRDGMAKLLSDIDGGLWKPGNKLVQHYARGLRAWKTGVTIYYPSHHIRNMIGDLHLMWWAGHNDPRNFIKARKILHTQRQRYQHALKEDTLDGIQRLIDKDAMEWAGSEGGDIILRQNGVSLTADQIYIAAHQHGLLLDANKYEDIFGDAPLSGILPDKIMGKQVTEEMRHRVANPLGGNAHAIASNVAEYREHYVRLSHFVGAINKGLKKNKNLDEVLESAAREVRKWHPDGRDLTKFEQQTRMIIPFYSWTRKALPLIVQAAVQRPSKVLYYPRASMALSGMMGVEQPSILDPFPDDQLFPDWIRAKGSPAFMFDTQDQGFFERLTRDTIDEEGNPTGYGLMNPSNPFMDVVEQIGGLGGSPQEIFRSALDSTTPAIKIPGDIGFDQTFSGAPISADKPGGQGHLNYLLNQIPPVAGANNVAEIDFRTMQQKEIPDGRETGRDFQALLNYLTAGGFRGTGPYVKTAEFEAKEREQK